MSTNISRCKFCGERLEQVGKYMFRCTGCTATYYSIGSDVKEVYVAPIKYSKSLALDTLLMWIKKYLGAPPEMYFDAEITWSRLLLLPYYSMVSRIKGGYTCQIRKAIYSGKVLTIPIFTEGEMYRHIRFVPEYKEGMFDRQINISIPLHNYGDLEGEIIKMISKVKEAILNPNIPLENKVVYRWRDISDYNPMEIKIRIDYDSIPDRAYNIGRRYIMRILSRICRDIHTLDLDMDIYEEYPIYLPIWIFKYKLKKGRKMYIGVVEGATGRVLYATYPVEKTMRLGFLGLGTLHLAVSGLLLLAAKTLALPISIPLILYSSVYFYRGMKMGMAREI